MLNSHNSQDDLLTFFVDRDTDIPSTFESKLARYKQRPHSGESYRYTTAREQRERRMKRENKGETR